ncbi:siphovirus Gp157 family protein [Salicibibacter halophilus]|uniref:Siphovirus Gp157 family protein n=1 Tax=Salicibibacter halophilus TaxID=2502791 RepID=A0A514LEG7_9BACI|nr:siphovirus Gp157 family protein [Salicibibacter halophilus]QDI90244.1 siphovirus Gp157 family protein [Salicibibacter halophilus]
MSSLYELTDNYKLIQRLIEEGADAEKFTDTLQAIEDSIDGKAEGYFYVIKNIESDINAMKAEEKRLADRRKAAENKVKRMKEDLTESMIETGKRKVKTPVFTANVQNNPPSVRVIDEGLIPKAFFIEQEPKIDRKGLLNSLKEGDETEGAEIIQTESVRFK